MSEPENKCMHLIEVMLIPLNGVHPVTFSMEIDLVATALELKKYIIKWMTKHNQRIAELYVKWYNTIQECMMIKQNICDTNYLVPTEIVSLCRSFYGDYYSHSVRIKAENLTVLANHSPGLLEDEFYEDDFVIYDNYYSRSGITKLKVYELHDNQILNKYFKFNEHEVEYEAIRIFHEAETLVMKIPRHIVIESDTMIDMVKKILQPYMQSSPENGAIDLFDIHIGEFVLTELVGICFINIEDGLIYPIMDNQERKELMLKFKQHDWHMKFLNHLSLGNSIQITWNQKAFRNEIFKNPIDISTIENNVCGEHAIEFDDNETDTTNYIFDFD